MNIVPERKGDYKVGMIWRFPLDNQVKDAHLWAAAIRKIITSDNVLTCSGTRAIVLVFSAGSGGYTVNLCCDPAYYSCFDDMLVVLAWEEVF